MKKLISALSIIEFATVLVINASTIGIITEIIAETKTTIAPNVSFLNQFFMRKNKLLKKLYLSLVLSICIPPYNIIPPPYFFVNFLFYITKKKQNNYFK